MSTEQINFTHSGELADLAKALVAVQAEVPAIPKESDNPFFRSKYADFADVKAVADPIVTKHGLVVTQWPGHNDRGDTLVTMLLHASGQWMKGEMQLHLTKDDAQGQGSALTYAKRYAYMASLGLVADEDDDGNKASHGNRNGSQSARPSPGGKPKAQASARQESRPRQQSQARPPAKKADPVTGEMTHDLQTRALREIASADRPKFFKVCTDAGVPSLRTVPDSKKAEIERLIGEWGTGRPFAENGTGS